jgi:signal transduction histidine kinase
VLVSTVVWMSGWRLLGHEGGIIEASLWFGRNACGAVVVGTALLLLIRYYARPRPRPRLSYASRLELLAACATSAVFYLLVFVADYHSMLFLLLGVGVWFGARFGTLINALHTLVVGHLAVLATLAGTGPFAQDEPRMDALLVQVFLLATAGTVLALSTGLEERRALDAELVQSTQETTYQAQLMNAVLNSMAEGLAVVDDGGRWLLRNPAATKVGGFAGDLRTLLSTSPDVEDPLDQALAGHSVRDVELRVSDPPGAGRILAVSAAPLPRDSVTGRARALLIFRDATVEHARRVDLTAFAEVVAHDLRNPLAAVESWTEMMALELGDGTVEPELVRDYVDRVGSGTRRMKGLIEDLLGRATHDSTLQLRRVDVTALAEEVAADHGAIDHVKVGDVPDVLADAALVRQVLDNLIGNALKFVPDGDDPRVSVTGRRTDYGTVAIAVADEGIGLPSGAHDRIFDQHHRAHSSYDGRGLGLAICRRIVERHGGSITALDAADGGAVFEFTLPSPD